METDAPATDGRRNWLRARRTDDANGLMRRTYLERLLAADRDLADVARAKLGLEPLDENEKRARSSF
jgi:hypothetical protein